MYHRTKSTRHSSFGFINPYFGSGNTLGTPATTTAALALDESNRGVFSDLGGAVGNAADSIAKVVEAHPTASLMAGVGLLLLFMKPPTK